jgi:SAM-dependent methyltransferase
MEELFDRAEEYEAMLQRGIGLSGEDQRFFVAGRIQDLLSQLPIGWVPSRILDFGCGLGYSSKYLADRFPGAEVVGLDTAWNALNEAQKTYGSARIRFQHTDSLADLPRFDLCYVNGVFHHIVPGDRVAVVRSIYDRLNPGGYFALFENNPWNPGTRMVMKRIPFDRDAITLTPPETLELVCKGGFSAATSTRFLFYFPRPLAVLRPLEPALAKLPLGAQYYVLGVKR